MKENFFDFVFWCDLVDRPSVGKSSILEITRNRTKEACVKSIHRRYTRWLKDQPAATPLAQEQSPVMQQASLKA